MQRFVQLRRVEPDLYRVEAVFFSPKYAGSEDESGEVISVEAPAGKMGDELSRLMYRSGKWISPGADSETRLPPKPLPVLDPSPFVSDPTCEVGSKVPPWVGYPPIDRLRAWIASWKHPKISILIPNFNKLDLLMPCLQSLERTTRGYSVEVIIGDTGSSPQTLRFYHEIGIPLVRCSLPFNFSKVCNALASAARGEYVLFLNNDTSAVTDGWPGILLRRGREEIVGAVLVYPKTNKIQHAGLEMLQHDDGHIYSAHTGVHKPLEVLGSLDTERAIAVTGAFLFMPRKTFVRLGGFDVAFRFELNDADLCIRARQAGISVSVCKEVTFVHYESASRAGAYVYPEKEWRYFVGRCGTAVKEWQAGQYVTPRLDKGRVLIVDDHIPDPSGGLHFPRTREFIRLMLMLNCRVSFFPTASREAKQPWTNIWLGEGIDVVTNVDNFLDFSRERAGYYDTIIVSRPHNFKKVHALIRVHFPSAFVIYDSEALFFVRDRLRAKTLGLNPAKAEEEGKIELELMSRSDRVISVSSAEKHTIVTRRPDLAGKVFVWGHSLPLRPTPAPFHERRGILFVGNLNEGNPNEDAIVHFVQTIYPKIRQALGCALTIVGSSPSAKVLRLASDSVRVTGFVPESEMVAYYNNSRVFVVPHRFAAGIPWKLHEAMSFGIPAVVTPLIGSQLILDGTEALIARLPDEFVEKTIRLYNDPAIWSSVRAKGLDLVRRTCSPDTMRGELRKILMVR